MADTTQGTMKFRNFGGIHQFVVESEVDLAKIDALDPARWAATSAPLADLHCDPAFLAYIDPESTGRIRVSQLIVAREWLFARLARRGRLREKTEVLMLDDLAGSEAAQHIRKAAEQLIFELKLESKTQISLANVRAFRDSYQKTLANGDGVVPADYVPEPEIAQAIKDILATTLGQKDAGGLDGLGAADLERFVARAQTWLEWKGRGSELIWGADTDAAATLVASLDAKIEEYFWHCDLMKQEASQAENLRLKEDELRALKSKDAATIEKYLAESPLAMPHANGTLTLAQPVNPVYRDAFDELRAKVFAKALPPGTLLLTRALWRQVKATFHGFNNWMGEKPTEPFEALGEERVKALMAGALPERITYFMGIDSAAAPGLAQVGELEKLILYQRWLLELANNFVNFSAIYRPTQQAMVEMGSIVIDGRRLDFCLKVADRAAHKKVAAESLIFLVYAQIMERDTAAPAYEILAPVTGGEHGRLRVGKRGIFIDLAGKEWDAVIVELVENPISVWEAAVSPFRKAQKFISKKIQDWVGSRQQRHERRMMERTDGGIGDAQKGADDAAAGKAAPAPRPNDREDDGEDDRAQREGLNVNSLVLGGGMALAGLGAVLAGLFGMLTSIKGWLAILAIVAAVMALSGLLGWLKLRRRDMSLMLEASGWAVNIEMKLNRRIARLFTFTPPLPPGSVIERIDELKTKEDEGNGGLYAAIFIALVLLLAVLAFYFRARITHFAGR